MRGEARFPTVQKEVLAELARGQQPFATILGCSDSRVPPELVFDATFGELFVARVAGNVLGPSILGTLQYAGAHLQTPLFVVLGHQRCGAVEAALATTCATPWACCATRPRPRPGRARACCWSGRCMSWLRGRAVSGPGKEKAPRRGAFSEEPELT